MKYLFLTLFSFPLYLFSTTSGVVGTWAIEFPDREGNAITAHITMKEDNTYTVDFGADKVVEITGTYTVDGNQITIQDDEGNRCTGKGVYKFTVTEDSLTMEEISEECEGRASPEGVMAFKKV